ncbi:CMRF35-like molecule 5 isoform X3 [Triplophysa dalaica]|uniref:CMRF35-like molecule 5 isoform X3 n=1 Tax=Triplophysa dalaica TaxID=1582913 RepID=UPI0024DFB94A|nr:CMRF35-like molecule 5 isoform X3 [Triplophysa dalaica]
MKFALAWICLAGFGISATYETDIHGHEGKHVTVECVHGHASTNKKYSCKDPCNDDDVLVSSDRSPNKRFSLKDFGNSTFTVTITDLQESDSGIYWCGVNRSAALDTYLQITLRINKDTHMTLRTTTSSTTVTTSDSQTSKSRSFTPAPNDITTSFTADSHRTPRSLFYTSTRPDDINVLSSSTGLLMVFIMGPAGLLTFGLVLCMMNMQNRETNRSKDPEHHDADTINICTKTARDIMETQQQDDTFNVVYFTVSQSPPANQIQDTLVSSTLYFQSKIGQL